MLPLSSVRRNSPCVLCFTNQMRHFVYKSDEERIRIEIVVNRDLVSMPAFERAVIAQFGGARACNLYMNVVLHHPLRTSSYR